MTAKTFLQDTWYGGESNDEFIATGKGQVYSASSIDINNSSKSFIISNSNHIYANAVKATTDYTVQSIIETNSKLLKFMKYGEVYDFFGLVIDTGKNIVNATSYNGKGIVFYDNGSIDTWTYDSGANDLGFSTLVSNVITGLEIDGNFAPYTIFGGDLFLATGDNIYTIDIATMLLINTTTLLDGVQARGITRTGDQYTIYVLSGTSSIQYIWDGSETLASYSISWYDRQVLNVATINNIDYVVCRDGLYRVNGYQPEILYRRVMNSDYTNAIETFKNKIYIPGRKCIYAYQFTKPGFPANIIKEIILPVIEGNGVTCLNKLPPVFDYGIQAYTQDLMIYYTNYYIENATKPYQAQYSGNRSSSRNSIGGGITTNYIPTLYGTSKASKKVRLGYDLCPLESTNKTITYNGITNNFTFQHSIAMIGDRETNKISLYVGGMTLAIAVGDIYNILGQNCTVTSVDHQFNENALYHGWITFETPTTFNNILFDKTLGKITKVSGSGDATVLYCVGYIGEVIHVITDPTKHKQVIMYPGEFNKMRFSIHITEGNITTDSAYNDRDRYTRVYDLAFLYDETKNDLFA